MSEVRAGGGTDAESGQPVVLVVDDDEEVADTYALWLESDYDVRTAYGGNEALESLSDDIDVVLLDRRMPNVPGDEVLERLRERGVDCQVSMLTAVAPDSDLTDLDFDDYLVKPVSKSSVVDIVEELLMRESLEEETQEYLSLKSTAEALDERDVETVRDPEAVAELHERLDEAGESQTVQRESAELDRLKEFNGLMRTINQTVVEVDSKAGLDVEVCEQFVENSSFEAALIGEYSETYDEFIPTADATGAVDMDAHGCDDDDPIRTAVTNDEVKFVDLASHPDSAPAALSEAVRGERASGSAVVVPTSHRKSIRGAIVAWADDRSEMSDRERTVLHELGDVIGNAADSLQMREMVHADKVVELELQVSSRDDVFVDLSAEYDCRVQLDGVNLTTNDGVVCYLTVAEAASDDVVEFLVQREGVSNCRLVDDRGDDLLVECTVHDSSVVLQVMGAGGKVTNLFVDAGKGHISLDVPPEHDIRSLFESVKSEFESVDLVSKRNTDRSYQSVEGYRASLEENLTERQDAVVDTAYNAGYFDWPRESTAEEVAEGLEMAPPTFHEHLREAQRKLVEIYLDETR